MKPAFLVAGSDEAKIAASRRRLRARAEGEGGQGALHVFEPGEGRGGPPADELIAAIPALSLTAGRRYLLADHVERWSDADQHAVAEALGALPEDLTVVLIAHGKPSSKLTAGGARCRRRASLLRCAAPAGPAQAAWSADATERGFSLDPGAARMLAARIGANPLRLAGELDRLALWAGEGGEVGEADLEAMVSDASEAAVWSLSDALLEGDAEQALCDLRAADRAGRERDRPDLLAGLAAAQGEPRPGAARGRHAAQQIESELGMHPYAAKQLLARLENCSAEQIREATEALADLEVWCRGGAEYGDELALTLALRRAAGVAGLGRRTTASRAARDFLRAPLRACRAPF